MPEVCVVHLVWAPLGPGPVERFVASYRQNPAGLAHRLVVVLKGFASRADADPQIAALGDLEYEISWFHAPTLDLSTYAAVADELDGAHLCFLNSESVLLSPGWLAALHDAITEPGVGVVGATGSYEAPRSMNPVRRRRWPGFPNPHIRTNAFMLSRDRLRSLRWPEVQTKAAAWELESGRQGMTSRILDGGLQAMVVGRNREVYPPERWPSSATFRSGDQANLLVADNRTRDWERAEPKTRTALSRLAWGSDPRASAERVSRVRGAVAPRGRPPTATA